MEDNIPAPEVKPDYYVSGQYRGTEGKGNYNTQKNYTLSVFEGDKTITVKELRNNGEEELTYESFKAFSEDWMHVTQLLKYQP